MSTSMCSSTKAMTTSLSTRTQLQELKELPTSTSTMPRGPCRPLYKNVVDIINKVDEDDVTRPVYEQEVEKLCLIYEKGVKKKAVKESDALRERGVTRLREQGERKKAHLRE